MDYISIYNSLIDRARNRVIPNEVYKETHHIIPTCLGGENIAENKVELTHREHFVCHRILHIIHPSNKQLAAAFHITAYGTNARNTRKGGVKWCPSSRSLEAAKIAKVMARIGTNHTDETKAKMSESHRVRRDANLHPKRNPLRSPITRSELEDYKAHKLAVKL